LPSPGEVTQYQLRLLVDQLRQRKPEPEAREMLAQFGVDEDKFNVLLPRAKTSVNLTAARLPVVEDPDEWRKECKSFGELTNKVPRFLIGGLVPEKALTAVCSPPFNGKTWLSLAMGQAISTGKTMLNLFDSMDEPIPVIYHVPEMNEAFVRMYMEKIGIEDSDRFLVRPMELGLWALDSPKMLRSSEGRVVFLDTQGYFNPAEDSNAYNQSLKFASLVYKLLEHAVGVVALFHPPKYANKEKHDPWSLENSILGSAGYGGILRSCLRMKNLNPDLNDGNPWIYVQGFKNPGLKPFQLEGIPLRMKVKPGDCPYLADLVASSEYQDMRAPKVPANPFATDKKYFEACNMFKLGMKNRAVRDELKIGDDKVKKYRRQYVKDMEDAELESAGLVEY
jgi:hypothetical protein